MKKFVVTVAALVSVLGVAAAAGQAAAVPPVCTPAACGGFGF